MSVVWMSVGATNPGGATFACKVDGDGPVRVAVATDQAMTSPVFTSSQAVDAQGVCQVAITGLAPSTAYFWQVEDAAVLDTAVTGRFRTHPPLGSHSSFTIAVGACAGQDPDFPATAGGELDGSRISDHPVYDTIRASDPLMFVNIGDWGYPDWSTVVLESLANRRTFNDDLYRQPNPGRLLREVAFAYAGDDHDFADNNSDGTYPDKANYATVHRERVPSYDLPDAAGAVYTSWQIGRVLCVLSDTRFHRSPNTDPDGPSKTMLGADQKAWLASLLNATSAEFLLWFMPTPWIGPDDDAWPGFATERQELADLLAAAGFADRMCMIYGDRHAAGIDSGGSNDWGSFPLMQAACIDSIPGETAQIGRFDILEDTPGRAQWGTVTVSDLGSSITVTLSAWRSTSQLGSYSFAVALTPTPSVTVADIAELVTGSHTATFEARVLTTFQTGDLPDGQTIPILGGDVTYDATADTFGSLTLTTEGVDELGVSRFPRVPGDLLAPMGNEVFVRRGVDLGGNGIVWVPLGYFRLNEDDQAVDSDHPVTLQARDRMAGIVDARLIHTREYAPDRTISAVVEDLVREVYPLAVVAFDDDSGQRQLGRPLLIEEDRYGALRDVANSLGKIMFFDGEGVLRIQDAPDPEVISWELNAGSKGVVFDIGRRVSREETYNAVVARGEAGGQVAKVQAVAVDIGPNSPTRWFPPDDPAQLWFGRKPRFYSSPLLTDLDEAAKAARSLLLRYLGMPYEVDFGVVPNPALRPFDVVRVTHKDGNRERHIVDTVTIPLVYSAAMTGTTRQQTQLAVSAL